MTEQHQRHGRRPVVLGPGEGRAYPMGRSRQSSRRTAPRPVTATRSRSGGSTRTRKGPGPLASGGRCLLRAGGHHERAGRHRLDRGEHGSFVLVPGESPMTSRTAASSGPGCSTLGSGRFRAAHAGHRGWFAEHPPGDTERRAWSHCRRRRPPERRQASATLRRNGLVSPVVGPTETLFNGGLLHTRLATIPGGDEQSETRLDGTVCIDRLLAARRNELAID